MKSFLEHSAEEISAAIVTRIREAIEKKDRESYSYWMGYGKGWSGLMSKPRGILPILPTFWDRGYDDGVGDRESIFPPDGPPLGLTDQG